MELLELAVEKLLLFVCQVTLGIHGLESTVRIILAIIHIMAQQDLRSGDGPIALILSPTRELAKQVDEVAKLFGKCCGINSVAVYGGADKNVQISQLNKGKCLKYTEKFYQE